MVKLQGRRDYSKQEDILQKNFTCVQEQKIDWLKLKKKNHKEETKKFELTRYTEGYEGIRSPAQQEQEARQGLQS